jgi:hypothetical protein
MRARRHFSRAVLATALLALLGPGCGITGPSDPLDRERERLEQARAQWRSLGIADYRFTFQRACFCAPSLRDPALVNVLRGAIVSVESVPGGAPQDPALYYTVEQLFQLIEDAIDQDAARLSVTYDSGLGYPTSGFIDRNEMIADEELGFEASSLEQLR